jgi:tRNA pseudouridine55 synthase
MSAERRPPKRAVDGVLVLNKPAGFTSNQALQKARWLLQAAKAGHTGSLDPIATGVLPLCFGEATKFSQYLLDADKTYRATVLFGRRSDTGDREGKILSDDGASGLDLARIEAELPAFRGDIEQIPPMFSALKHQGQPLYKLAREGLEVERSPRKVQIYRLEVIDCRPRQGEGGRYTELDIEVACSKGTYIRSLAMDLGDALGCGGLITALHRSKAGPFVDSEASGLAELERERSDQPASVLDHHLLPITTTIGHLQAVKLPEASGHYFRQGQPVLESSVLRNTKAGETVAVFLPDNEFLGVAEILTDGRIAPRRLIATASNDGK